MTTHASLTLKGLEEYLEKVVQAGNDIEEAALRAVLAGAEVIQDGMQNRAPVKTGNLRDHIKIWGPNLDGYEIWAHVGVIHDARFTDDETARYANAQEYGTSSMPAHPYIRPAIDQDSRKARQAMRESLERDGML
jgi:HK97 gp10 family phage protein